MERYTSVRRAPPSSKTTAPTLNCTTGRMYSSAAKVDAGAVVTTGSEGCLDRPCMGSSCMLTKAYPPKLDVTPTVAMTTEYVRHTRLGKA